MADTATHAIMGAAVMSLCSKQRSTKIDLAVYGLIFGAWPDAVPWVLSSFGRDRWALYNVYHHSLLDFPKNLCWIDFMPPALLHVLVDIPFHPSPGYPWGSNGWLVTLDIALLLFSIALGIYSFTAQMEKP